MRIAIAPNAFRGSLTAQEAAEAIAAGLRRSALKDPGLLLMPLADGGDGTLDVLLNALGGERVSLTVKGPMGTPVAAQIALLADGQRAVVEMAKSSGVELIPKAERNPLLATSYGLGELIAAALKQGRRRVIIGLGGSATVDGGAGCLQALGADLLTAAGDPIAPGGDGLAQLASIDLQKLKALTAGAEFIVLCDVTNPLLGDSGAARVFGPQKGATPQMVERLESNLSHFADVIQQSLGIDVRSIPGGGTAGGTAAGLATMLGASLVPGAETLINMLDYEGKLAAVDLLITGEGKLDAQTGGGKAVQGIANAARQQGIPVIAFAGVVEADAGSLEAMGIAAAWSIVCKPCTLEEAIANAREWLTLAARQLGNVLALR